MKFELTTEQMDIKRAAREFAEKEFTAEKGREYDEKYQFPWEFYRKAAKLGFIGPDLPEEYGGQGLGCIEDCIVAEEFNRVDSTCASILTGCMHAYTLVSIAIILLLGFFQLLLLRWCLCEGKRTRLRAREKKTETQRERFNLKEIIEDALRRDQVILLSGI